MSVIPTSAEQQVILYKGSDIKGTQSVTVSEEEWITVSHCGHEQSMSIENWKKLVVLANSILPNEKGAY